MRAVGYIRVSTVEQKMHGYSLEAQRELLERYADEHGMRIVEIYADEGKSASKELHKRKEILRLLEDAEAGKFDTILFKDLTRWSRNPAQFYAVQERLDKARVSWIAVEQPNLETVTASGKFAVGIHISVAAHESNQTSERIKFVNASRVQKGGVLTGSLFMPLGYAVGMVDGQKRVIIDESKKDMVNAMFDIYEKTGHIVSVVNMTRDVYGFKTNTKSIHKMLRNTMYKGEYRGVEGYCPAYLSPERWEAIRRISEQHHYTAPVHKNEYIFSSLVKCADCGTVMIGRTYKNGRYVYYGCQQSILYHTCPHRKGMREDVLEKYLVETIDATLSRFEATTEEKAQKQKNPAPIRAKLARAKELYIEGDITREEYTARRDALEEELKSIDTSVDALQRAKNALPDGWQEYYKNAPKEARRAAWRAILDRIEVDTDGNITPYFI